MAYKCPLCDNVARRIDRQKDENKLSQKAWYQCRNLSCGATFETLEEFIHSLQNPEKMNESVSLPFSQYKLQKPTQDNLFEGDMSNYKCTFNDGSFLELRAENALHAANAAARVTGKVVIETERQG